MAGPWERFQTTEQGPWSQFAAAPPPPPEKQSAFRQIADVPLGIAKGAVQGVRMIADAFGAGSDTSKTIKSAETYLADLMSAQAKNDQQEISRIMKDAEDKGVLDQVKAGIKAFTVAPVDTLSSALGTATPVIVGALGAKILGAGALVTTGVSALTGAGMGAGVVKGSIYEETKKALKEAGASEQDAEARAQLAQQYNGKNLDQILLGTVLGGAAAVGPLEKGGAAILARRILGKTGTEATETVAEQAAKGAVRRRLEAGALEAVPEAVQAGQEQVAQNIALQREGFDVPTFRGAVSAATLEGLAGAGLGAAVGGGKPAVAPAVPPPEAPPAPPPAALEYKPEPFIQFPDGTVAKRSEVEAYIKTLPEDQQMAMRAKLLGLAPQEAEAPPAEPTKALEFKPEPLIVYPDGSVARSSEVAAYIQSLPEDEQVAARAKLLGMGEVATRVTPEMLRKLGIRGRAPIIQRLSGLELTDPKVTEELTNFASQPYASPEVRGNIFGFLNTIKPAEAPVAPPVEPAAEAPVAPVAPAPPPVAAVEPSVAEDSELVTPAPVVEAAAPVEPPSRNSEAWRTEGKTPEQLMADKVESVSSELAAQIADEASAQDFSPNELPTAIQQWASDAKIPADDLRLSVIKALDKFDISDARKAQVKKALSPLRAAPAAPTVEAAAPKAEAPPTLDTSDIKEVKGRHPQVQAAAKLLQDKKISREEFEKYVDYYKPIQEVESEKLLPPTSEQRMNETVNADKRDRINVPVADGTKVGLRMDLPARERGGSVVSIHEGKPGKMTVGKLMGFRSTGWLKDVTFEVRSQEKGLAVAAGAAKAPQQTVEGTWQNLSPEETYARVKELMKDPAWKQIGFDPSRHGYFYDRKTREPVVSASEMYQVGQFLLAKDVEYAPKENFLYSVEPTVKSDRLPSYKRGVENLRKRWDKGEITAEEFANRVDMLARQIESVELAKEFKGRERGADFIRQRLLEAKRRGDLSEEAVDFAEWFILRNPALVDDLGISIRTPKEDGVGGMYSEMARVMYLMKERGNDQTIVHEILHHLERMMPKDVQTAIRKNWIKSLMEAQKNAKSDAEKTFFSNLTDYHFGNGPRAKLDAAIEAIKNGDVEPSFYQYTSPSEFWAVNGSEIMQGRFDAKGALLQRLKRWLSELKEKARDLFGLNSTAPIIRALDSLSKGDGKFVSKTLLDDVRETRQVIEREGAGKKAGEAKSLRDRATDNFRRWFGDSKVVDEKGEPLVVYHGTKVDFSEFSREFFGSGMSGAARNGFFFTSDPVEASDYASGSAPGGQVMPLYLSIQKPFELKFADHKIDDIIEADEKVAEYLRKSQGIVSKMRGVDGLILRNIGGQKGKDLYVAFRPEQIKSAIGNNGDYSLTNADIRKSLAGKRSTQEIARIFGQMVKRAENEMTSVLFNWNDSQLNEDKDKIIMYPGRDQRFVRGKEGGKSNVSKAEFIDWLMSDGPFDTSVYGEEITSDEKWRNEIETLRGIVEQPDIRKSIGGIKAAAQKALQNQPMPEKGLGHVKQDLKNLAQPIFFAQNKTILDRIDGMKDRFWQRVAQNTADQFRTIKEYSPLGYMQARLSKSVDGGLEGLLFHGQVFDDGGALNIKAKTKGMVDILKPLGNELDSYLMWVALNRESRLPEAKRSKIPNMDQLVARRGEFAAGDLNGKPRVEVYEDVLKQMNQLNKSVLDIALAKGLINQEAYDKFSSDIYYIPFYKKMEEDGDISGAQTASGLTSQYFSKELKGGDKPFGDLMENVVRNWSHILSASMKNAAAKTTLDDAMELGAAVPNLKVGLEWKDGKVYSIKSGKPIEAKVDEDGKVLYEAGVLRPDLTKQDAGMAKVMVDGQPMYFKVTDDLLMDSISSIGYLGPKSKFLDVARNFKNMLQYGVTASPIFKVNNLIRDSVAAMAVSDLKKNPVANVMNGISLSKEDSPVYISALAGGAIFNFGSAYEGDQAKLIKRLLDQGVPGDSILDTKEKITKGLKNAWDAYQHLGDRSEAANRLSLYQQMRDKGMTHLQASFMARDLLDFSMQGSWPAFRLITQVVPFMNARIQGLYKLGRDGIIPTTRVLYNATTGKEIDANDKIRAAQFATVTTAVMLASALLYLSFKDDEDFKKRDAWDRDNFWWIKLPGMDMALRVPKPFEVGAFGTLVERSLEQILDEGAEGKQFGESLARTLWDTFALNPTPQMFKPLVDIYSNKDSFSGAPIESAGLERLSKQERATDQTSPLGIALGGLTSVFPEKFQLSPVQADYILKGYFGWLGAMASVTSTYAVMPFKEGEYPDARWLDRASLGLARELPAPQSAYVTQFYNASKEISQAYADMRHYREMGDAEKVQEILEEKGDKIALAKFYDKTAKNIANVRKQIQLITNDKDMGGAEKREAIERMKLIMSDLAKQAEEVRKSMK